jgi:arylsulfatase A-like enzyme
MKLQRMTPRPNVIWFFGDQHRRQALSCAGDPNVSTPNIDRLAVNGFSSSAAVAGFPLCCAFRGSLLTGRYPHHCVDGHQKPLPDAQQSQTIASALKNDGYRTAWFGKWHLDGFQECDGRAAFHHVPKARRGDFDHWIGYENNNAPWDCWVHGHDVDGNEIPLHVLKGFEPDRLTDLLIEHVLQWGRRGKEALLSGQPVQPFFAALSAQPPHNPYAAPARWMERHRPANLSLRPNVPEIQNMRERARRELAGYYAMIENLDHNLGRIMDALIDAELAADTHVLFFSDHGDMHGSHGIFHKTCPWEEAIGIPFIMGGHQSVYDFGIGREPLTINHVDIAPTTLGLCGIKKPDGMAGYDYSSFRVPPQDGKGASNTSLSSAPDSAYLQSVVPTGHPDSIDRPWRGVVTRDGWKYICLEGQPWLLFNLNEDRYEQMNLAFNTRYQSERHRLQDRLAQWISDTRDHFPLPAI